MGITGGCRCGNITVSWQTRDYSVVPRACQCDYCASRSASYVSKSGTRFEVLIRQGSQHRCVHHGSRSASFHECGHCNELVFVSAELDGTCYGVLNSHCLNNSLGFSPSRATHFSDQTAEQMQERWRRNWCGPIYITVLSGPSTDSEPYSEGEQR